MCRALKASLPKVDTTTYWFDGETPAVLLRSGSVTIIVMGEDEGEANEAAETLVDKGLAETERVSALTTTYVKIWQDDK